MPPICSSFMGGACRQLRERSSASICTRVGCRFVLLLRLFGDPVIHTLPHCTNLTQGAKCAVLKVDQGGAHDFAISSLVVTAGFRVVYCLGRSAYCLRDSGCRLAASGGRGGQRGNRLADRSRWRSPPGVGVSRPSRGQLDLEAAGGPGLYLHRRISTHAPAAGGGVVDAAAGITVPDRRCAGHGSIRQTAPRAGSRLAAV